MITRVISLMTEVFHDSVSVVKLWIFSIFMYGVDKVSNTLHEAKDIQYYIDVATLISIVLACIYTIVKIITTIKKKKD